MKNESKSPIIVGRMAYERYRLIETKDGIIRQGMGLNGKVESLLVHVTGGVHVRFSTKQIYDTVPIEWVTTDENLSMVDIGVIESNKILSKQTKHILSHSRIKINRKHFIERLNFLEKQKQNYQKC